MHETPGNVAVMVAPESMCSTDAALNGRVESSFRIDNRYRPQWAADSETHQQVLTRAPTWERLRGCAISMAYGEPEMDAITPPSPTTKRPASML